MIKLIPRYMFSVELDIDNVWVIRRGLELVIKDVEAIEDDIKIAKHLLHGIEKAISEKWAEKL